MAQTFQVTGELVDPQNVKLHQPVPLPAGKVRVVIELLEDQRVPDRVAFEKLLRERQKARDHVPPSAAEVESYLESERRSWGE